MSFRCPRLVLCLLFCLITAYQSTAAARPRQPVRPPSLRAGAAIDTTIRYPVWETRLHYVGRVWLAVSTDGSIGWGRNVSRKDRDRLRIKYSPACEFPGGTRNEYLSAGGLWVGGVVGIDTLVSDAWYGSEWTSYDTISESSSSKESFYYSPQARAEQEYYAVYTDTLTTFNYADELTNEPYKPLNLEVAQTSYAWSDKYSRQFVIFESWIKNIGHRAIDKLALGVAIDADVGYAGTVPGGGYLYSMDDIAGFLSRASNRFIPGDPVPVNVGWVADNDGDPVGGRFARNSPDGAIGVRILRAPRVERYSFNWWQSSLTPDYDWGPTRTNNRNPHAIPSVNIYGDRNRYALMTNGEIDYDQMYTALDFTGDGWRPPPRRAGCAIAQGEDVYFVQSVGPACDLLPPGDSVPFVYAICMGSGFHSDPSQPFHCLYPEEYIATMNGNDLALTATWAGWLYDTPGYDTDGDGYRGEYNLVDCDSVVFGIGYGCDTVYYTGDLGPQPGPGQECLEFTGAPDYAGPETPPCPQSGRSLTVESQPHVLIARWSGRETETARDALSRQIDFEGYRIYVSRNGLPDSYSMIASWDREDYIRYRYDPRPPGRWDQVGNPVTIEQLWAIYDDEFDPSLHDRPSFETCYRDTIIKNGFPFEEKWYFEPHAGNHGNEYIENGHLTQNIIQRVAEGTVVDEFDDTLTYGTYEARIENLNPTTPLYVSLTSFDYGNPGLGLEPLETTPGRCYEYAVPIHSADAVEDSNLRVSVYPNPYKISFEGQDGRRTTYYAQGHEAPEKEGRPGEMDELDRRIWFINLPKEATIRIYTLDGDLIRDIRHPDPHVTSYPSCVGWDLISRNAQQVVSGIYIWKVDSKLGSQAGKLVIIK